MKLHNPLTFLLQISATHSPEKVVWVQKEAVAVGLNISKSKPIKDYRLITNFMAIIEPLTFLTSNNSKA
jgi:hypothetical protein